MKRRSQNIIRLLLLSGMIILLNVISSFVFTRIDLTEDKRFTLSGSTKQVMKNLKDVVFVKVYLEGDFPAGFERLSNATRELLDELRQYSNGNLEYEFINPAAIEDDSERNNFYRQLAEKGLQPTNLEEKTQEGTSQKIIFPGALVSYSTQEIPVQLLKDQIGVAPAQMLNNSIQNLEYEIINAIRKATDPRKTAIAFLTGHGELGERYVADITGVLGSTYDVQRVELGHQLGVLDKFSTVIVAKPDSAFDDKSKFILDQYIMKGGNAIFLIDQMDVSMDSLSTAGETMALGRPLNLDDMLFRYGVRINYDLVLDLQSSPIPVVTGFVGNQPRTELRPWYYFPVMTPSPAHPVSRNLNAIKGQFVSTMDTIGAPGIKKTILLSTSRYTRISPAPVRVSLGIMQMKANPAQYNQQFLTTAVLLEGSFESVFKNRPLADTIKKSPEIGYREMRSDTGKIVVIADGDIIANDFQNGRPLACGYDKYTGTFFGNRNFLQNLVDYLSDPSGLISVRSKDFKIRMLDPQVYEEKGNMISLINCVAPVAVIILTGIFKFYRRRKKYASA